MMRFPFASNKYFRMLLSLLALVAILKMLKMPAENVALHYFIMAVAAVIFIRGFYLFFKKQDNNPEEE
jgi:positive regulator of sigma E activity